MNNQINTKVGVINEKDVIAEFQRRYPREWEVVVQAVYINQLESLVSELQQQVQKVDDGEEN